MIEMISLPLELETIVGSEIKDFVVKAKRANPPKSSIFLVIFGAVWLGFTSIFFFAFLGPLFQGREVEFLVNDVPTTAGPGDYKAAVLPAVVIGVFVLVGLAMFLSGIFMLLKKGGYYVGTPTRLISFSKGKYRSVDWEQFSGDIEVTGNEQKGNLSLGMRTGRMVSSKNGPDRYVPDTLYISGVPNVYEIEQICRKRIKENDPTPAVR